MGAETFVTSEFFYDDGLTISCLIFLVQSMCSNTLPGMCLSQVHVIHKMHFCSKENIGGKQLGTSLHIPFLSCLMINALTMLSLTFNQVSV